MTDPVFGAIGQLDAGHPMTLMPLRLETRFRRGPVAGSPEAAGELLVRIYPDSILADNHEPLLSANEVAAGQDYWRRAFADGRENDAWTALLGEVRTPRAGWIVAQTTPSNVDQMAGRGAVPAFPTLQTRPEGWHRAPHAHGLPERWVVSGFRGGERVMQIVGAPIRADLVLTPRLVGDDASAPRVDLSGDGLTVEPELAWAYDVAEAVKAGMAVRIPLTSIDLEDGFTTLLVVGVRTTATADEQARDLADLLAGHQFSRGLAFVRQGTRTNNTGDGPSDYPPPDPAGTVSFAVARGVPTATSGTDGGRFATALGVPLSTVEHLAGAGRDEQSPAQAMVNALWPATIGYFLEQLFAPEVSQATVDAVRAWMQQWVRPRGPLPALRVGAVPYGVLPVAPLAAPPSAAPVGAAPPGLAGLVSRLASIAATLVAGPPHVGRTADPDRDLIELLGMDASASTARVRRTLGYDAAWNVFGFTGTDMTRWETDQRRVGQTVLTAIGEAGRDPRAVYLSFAGRSDDFGGPMVAPAPLSETDPLPFDYIGWLATATPAQLRAQTAPPSDQPVTALLYLMLRHALLTEYDRTARRVLGLSGLLFAHELREPELIGILPPPPPGPPPPVVHGQPPPPRPPQTRTAWDRFDVRVTGVTGDLTLGQFLALGDGGGPGTPSDISAALRELADLRTALHTLTGLPTAELHRLFTETLDACSHRIDAWVTSLATSRLAALRGSTPDGTWLGCYGWVEDLRADPAGDLVDVTLPDGSAGKARRDDAGFVTAPSMTHAAAAAVLRSAYLARSGTAQEPYTVDLSSWRVRRALAILDAVRDEQPLGSVLGAAFERGLHEGHPGVELDRFIAPLRRLYPAVAGKTEATGEPADAVAARSIVDGLALLRGGIPWGTGELTPSTEQRAAIESELAALAESVDAVSDLLLAESVFQVVKGSPSGAAATLDTLATGRRPPEPEVVATPRGGTVLHQRIAVLFGAGVLPPAWAGIPPTPRATAAPEVNAWLATLIGDPSQVECATPAPVTLAQLGLHPIDLLQLASSDLNALIVAHAGAPATVDYDTARPGRTPLGAVLELLRAAAELLGVGRALSGADLLPPERATTPAADAMESELDGRASNAIQALTQVGAELTAAQPTPPDDMLRNVAARFGITGTGPDVLAVVGTRLAAAASAPSAADRLAAVFGRSFPVVPRFRPAAPDLLGPALASEPGLTDDPDSVVEGWLAQLARVRPAVRAWCDVRVLGRALGASIARPRIAQLPGDGSRWAGLRFGAEEQRPRSGLTSLALAGASPPAADQPWSGLLLDSWPELLPNREEDTGLAFHYDAPGSQAPQAILIAVPPAAAPGTTGTWSYEHLERTLLDTLMLAKVRALDLSNLGSFAQLVPMTFLAANQANDAVSTSFHGLLVADAVVITPSGG